MCRFAKENVVCWLGVVRCFNLVPYSYNLTSWWSNLFLVFFHLTSISSFQQKIKAVNLLVCFSVIFGQNILSNEIAEFISEKSEKIACFFALWYWKLRVYRKTLGWVWSKMGLSTLLTELLNWLYLIK